MTISFKRFHTLSYDDLTDWAGSRIVSRGRNYQKQGRVNDLAITLDGGLLSWVDGTRAYATHVFFTENGQLGSFCSCPYGSRCKHAVATILEYVAHVEAGRQIPLAGENDERRHLVEELDEDVETRDYEGSGSSSFALLDVFLEKKTKSQLIDFIKNIAVDHPGVMSELVDASRVAVGDAASLLKRVRKEIRELSRRPGWSRSWSDERYTPDYSGVRRTLRTLLGNGHADAALAAGEDLLKFGVRHVEESDDDGETFDEVSSSLEVVAKALVLSTLAPEKKLLWAIDAMSEDDFGLCASFQEVIQESYSDGVWSRAADVLLSRLKNPESAGASLGCRYKRKHLVEMAAYALERAGREQELISLYASEVPVTQDYLRLVDHLLSAGMLDDAERWIHEGIKASKNNAPGTASRLREKLIHIRTTQQDWEAVVAMRVEDFAGFPSVQTYEDCKAACDRLGLWEQVRLCLLESLEKASFPWDMQGWPFENQALRSTDDCPMDKVRRNDILIDLALHEQDPERVLALYDKRPKQTGFWVYRREDEIAEAVRDYAPERAVRLWRYLAEQLIAQVKAEAYEEAATYLRKAFKVMERLDKRDDWDNYLAALRSEHKRKRRFVEILDCLDNRPIMKNRKG